MVAEPLAVRALTLAAFTWSLLVAGIAASGIISGHVSLSKGIAAREIAAMTILGGFMIAGLVTGYMSMRCARHCIVTPPAFVSYEKRKREERMAWFALWIAIVYVVPLGTLAIGAGAVALAGFVGRVL